MKLAALAGKRDFVKIITLNDCLRFNVLKWPQKVKLVFRQTPEDFTTKPRMIMKTKLTTALVAVLGALALAANAQDNNPPNAGPNAGDRPQRGPGMAQGQRPPLPAVVRALDANHDGVIDATEIDNASAALKTLDKDNDGKLTLQETMGPRPQMGAGRPDGQRRGPRGQGGENMRPMGPPPAEEDGNNPPPAEN
jgi:hypothetical protein